MFTYELNENNEVIGKAEGQEAPILYQPFFPDGTSFQNAAEAHAWGAAWVAHMLDPETNAFPA